MPAEKTPEELFHALLDLPDSTGNAEADKIIMSTGEALITAQQLLSAEEFKLLDDDDLAAFAEFLRSKEIKAISENRLEGFLVGVLGINVIDSDGTQRPPTGDEMDAGIGADVAGKIQLRTMKKEFLQKLLQAKKNPQ